MCFFVFPCVQRLRRQLSVCKQGSGDTCKVGVQLWTVSLHGHLGHEPQGEMLGLHKGNVHSLACGRSFQGLCGEVGNTRAAWC